MKFAFIFILFIASFLFIGGPNTHDLRVYFEFWQLGHFFLFAITVVFIHQIKWVSDKHFLIRLLATGLFSMLAGLATEILQKLWGRSFQFSDIINDIIGGYAGLFIAQTQLLFQVSKSKQVNLKYLKQAGYLMVVLVLAVYSGRLFIKAVITEYNIRADFPILSDFETIFAGDRWRSYRTKIEIAQAFAKTGEKGMKATFLPARYPSINLRDFRADWSNFNSLRISIYNPQQTDVKLHLKIYDHIHHHTGYRYNDRLNKTLMVKQGWNDFSVSINELKNAPKDRSMDIDEIYSFSFFMIRNKQPTTIYIDDIYLSR